jgi:hypothetical protein
MFVNRFLISLKFPRLPKLFNSRGQKEVAMQFTKWSAVLLSAVVFVGIGLSVAKAAEQDSKPSKEQWRYTYHNNEWWYWLPSNRWVYWRDNCWNDYNPRTFANLDAKRSRQSGAVSAAASQAVNDSDIRPFYGHSLSNLDRRPLEQNNEVGPFYGRALPTEVFGSWRGRQANRPFFGHAVSSYDY